MSSSSTLQQRLSGPEQGSVIIPAASTTCGRNESLSEELAGLEENRAGEVGKRMWWALGVGTPICPDPGPSSWWKLGVALALGTPFRSHRVPIQLLCLVP